jgi:hypothetical protein
MAISISHRRLRLSLRAGEALPNNLSWRIQKGYVWLASWGAGGEPLTLSVWGPGELVIPELITLSGVEVRSLSPVMVEEEETSVAMEREFLENQLHQVSVLLSLSRARPAESRLLQLLDWLASRFGTMTSQGVLLSFGEKALTHQQLADIAGLTRVTVTKALSYFRKSGMITAQSGGSLLLRIPSAEQRYGRWEHN